jgi:hypothetical protein
MPKEAIETLLVALENWATFFILLVVIGVGGELVVHVMQSRANKKLNAIQHAETFAQQTEIERLRNESSSTQLNTAKANEGAAEALRQAAKAEESLANARKEAALANERAAEANKIAEGERLARIKIEHKLAPRILSDENQKRIESKLKPFAGMPYELGLNAVPEAINLANTIDKILRSAGWVNKESAKKDFRFIFTLQSGSKVEQAFASGIVVQATAAFLAKNRLGIEVFVAALGEEGLDTTFELLRDDDPSPDALRVIIGSK